MMETVAGLREVGCLFDQTIDRVEERGEKNQMLAGILWWQCSRIGGGGGSID